MQKESSVASVSKIQRKIQVAQEMVVVDFVCKWFLKYIKEWKSGGNCNREITVQNPPRLSTSEQSCKNTLSVLNVGSGLVGIREMACLGQAGILTMEIR